MLEKDKFKEKINSVVSNLKNNDVNSAINEIMGVIDDYNQGYDELEIEKTNVTNLTETNKNLESKVSALKDSNIDLLLKVGSPKNQDDTTSNINNNSNGQGEKEPLKFEDLFNEKGEIK